MPPLCIHLGIAVETVPKLCHRIIDENLGSYYLGATAPDIRVLINADREDTHFLSLDSVCGATGVTPMLEAYPELSGNANVNAATRSFVAGYLSHLVTDEAWIYLIYRPFFGKSSQLKNDPMANLLDRLLQFELDRRERLNSESMSLVRAELANSTSGIDISFIDAPSLRMWSEIAYMTTTRDANWEQLRLSAEKYFLWMRNITPENRDDFFDSFDERMQQVIDMVPEEKIQEFRERSIADSVKVVREYLG